MLRKLECLERKLKRVEKACKRDRRGCGGDRSDPGFRCIEPIDGVLRFGDCCVPYSSVCCNRPFNLRLAELNQNLNFQLFGMRGCKVRVEYECQGSNDEVTGTVCEIGTDFLAVKKESGVVVTILKERICKIEWKDSCCHPCDGEHTHDGHCGCGCGGEHRAYA